MFVDTSDWVTFYQVTIVQDIITLILRLWAPFSTLHTTSPPDKTSLPETTVNKCENVCFGFISKECVEITLFYNKDHRQGI